MSKRVLKYWIQRRKVRQLMSGIPPYEWENFKGPYTVERNAVKKLRQLRLAEFHGKQIYEFQIY